MSMGEYGCNSQTVSEDSQSTLLAFHRSPSAPQTSRLTAETESQWRLGTRLELCICTRNIPVFLMFCCHIGGPK